MKIAVIGAGSWGSAAAWLLGNNGHDVALWARSASLIDQLNATQHNPLYLTDIELPAKVTGYSDLATALDGANAIVLATPSKAVRETSAAIGQHYASDTPVVLLSKGVENASGLLLADVVADVLGHGDGVGQKCPVPSVPPRPRVPVAVLSGPNHAEEVALGKISATVVASADPEVAALFQDLFSAKSFRVYTSDDVVGVSLCGAPCTLR